MSSFYSFRDDNPCNALKNRLTILHNAYRFERRCRCFWGHSNSQNRTWHRSQQPIRLLGSVLNYLALYFAELWYYSIIQNDWRRIRSAKS